MNTYGQLSNAELLHKYGFTEEVNPHDEVGQKWVWLLTRLLCII